MTCTPWWSPGSDPKQQACDHGVIEPMQGPRRGSHSSTEQPFFSLTTAAGSPGRPGSPCGERTGLSGLRGSKSPLPMLWVPRRPQVLTFSPRWPAGPGGPCTQRGSESGVGGHKPPPLLFSLQTYFRTFGSRTSGHSRQSLGKRSSIADHRSGPGIWPKGAQGQEGQEGWGYRGRMEPGLGIDGSLSQWVLKVKG